MKSLGLNPKKNMRIKTAPDKKVNLIDIAEELVHEIDQIRQSIGVDRVALIKIWLHERVQQEKSGISSR